MCKQEPKEMLDTYITRISSRGNSGGKGLLDLLDWCGKTGLYQVTEEEARRFWEDPEAEYER